MRVGAVRRAGLLDRGDLLEDLEVAPGEERAAVDDHVDLVARRPATASRGVGELDGRVARPDGNAVATAATWTPVPLRASMATGTRSL